MNRNSPQPARSWSDQESQVAHKWKAVVGLVCLLVLSLALFVYLMIGKKEPRVFLHGLTIPETRERSWSRPEFTNWKPSFEESVPWSRWIWLDHSQQQAFSRIESFSSLEAWGSELPQLFAKSASPRDTLIVYLRCLALNTRNGVVLVSPDATEADYPSQEEEAQSKKANKLGRSLENILVKLQDVRAANIVVLADIGDLTPVTKLKIPRTSVLEGLRRSLEKVTPKQTPIWLVSSVDEHQDTYVSYLAKRTLFQAAIENSLAKNVPLDDKNLSLADFYEQLLRFVASATASKQTPRLFCVGTNSPIHDQNSHEWQLAEEVCVGQRDKVRLAASKGEKSKQINKVSSASQIEVRRVRWLQESPSSSQLPTVDSATAKESAEQAAKLPDETAKAKDTSVPQDADLWLQFWQLRDQLKGRSPPSPHPLPKLWSPVDFAVDRWQTLQMECIRLDRLRRIADQNGSMFKSEIEQLTNELKFSSPAKDDLQSRWDGLKNEFDKPKDARRAWLKPELLEDAVRENWKRNREHFSQFLDAMAESALWLQLVANLEFGQSMMKDISDLFAHLNKAAHEVAKLQSLTDATSTLSEEIRTINEIRNKLRSIFDKSVVEMQQKLKQDPIQLSWENERQIQVLLSSCLLTYDQRKKLSQYEKLDSKNLLQPSIEYSLAWEKLLSKQQPPLNADTVNSVIEKLIGKLDPKTKTHAWVSACFVELGAAKSVASTLLNIHPPISQDSALFIAQSPSKFALTSAERLVLTVRQRNGVSVDSCWLKWDFDRQRDTNQSKNLGIRAEAIGGDRSQLKRGEPRELVVQNDIVRLEVSTTAKRFEEAFCLIHVGNEAAINESTANCKVRVYSPSEGVDLFVVNSKSTEPLALAADPARNSKDVHRSVVDSDGTQRLNKPISIPAALGATGQFDFYLRNQSDKKRVFRAKLYSDVNGRNVLFAAAEPFQLAAVSETTVSTGDLPQLQFAAVPELVDKALKQSPIAGLWLELTELEIGDNPKETGKKLQYKLDFTLDNPRDLVALKELRDPGDSGAIDLSLEVSRDVLSFWGIEKLEVSGVLSFDSGAPLNHGDQTAFNGELNLQQLSLNKRVTWNSDKPVVLHCDIGGFPRAIAREWAPSSNVSPVSANQSFAWIEEPMKLRSAKELPDLEKRGDAYILPNRVGASAKSKGEEIKNVALEMSMRLDFPKAGSQGKGAKIVLRKMDSQVVSEHEIKRDRDQTIIYGIQKGQLTVTAGETRDHVFRYSDVNKLNSGRYQIALSLDDKKKTVEFEVDKDPPTLGKVKAYSENREREVFDLQQGQSFAVAIEGSSDDIREVYFAIDRKGKEGEGEFDKDDYLKEEPAIFDKGKQHWYVVFSADDLKNRSGNLTFVARSIDRAGNIQDGHIPKELELKIPSSSTPKPSNKKNSSK